MKRSTGDLLVLMIAGTVCITIILAGGALVVVGLFRPEVDLNRAVGALTSVLSTLTGIVAGYLAGRTSRRERGDET